MGILSLIKVAMTMFIQGLKLVCLKVKSMNVCQGHVIFNTDGIINKLNIISISFLSRVKYEFYLIVLTFGMIIC